MTCVISGDTGVSAVQSGAVNPSTDIAYSQTWQDVTASRVLGTTYTNTTGQPIKVAVRAVSTAASQYLYVTVASLVVSRFGDSTVTGIQATCYAEVPAGATYSVSSNFGSGLTWMELR